MLRIGIPSNGALHKTTLKFLASCGLDVTRPNDRNYTGEIPTLPGSIVRFQRATDITWKVEDDSVDVGIVGYDRFLENRRGEDTLAVFPRLGFGGCSLVLAVPELWVDVSSVADLAEISVDFRTSGKDLRIATKFPKLVEQFLLDRGVNYFSLVPTSGALEVAPAMGSADMIADITETGTTLRENRLKIVHGGIVIRSQACFIVNKASVESDPTRLAAVRSMIDLIENNLRSEDLYQDAPATERL